MNRSIIWLLCYKVAWAITRNSVVSQDIASSTELSIWSRSDEILDPKPYGAKCAKNKSLNYLEWVRQWNGGDLDEVLEMLGSSDYEMQIDHILTGFQTPHISSLNQSLNEVITGLRQKHRDVIYFRLKGVAYIEIAKGVGISDVNARAVYSRFLAQLKKLVSEYQGCLTEAQIKLRILEFIDAFYICMEGKAPKYRFCQGIEPRNS